MKKPVISTPFDQPFAKPEARVPFFAKKLDEEALRSVRAGDGDMAMEAANKLGHSG